MSSPSGSTEVSTLEFPALFQALARLSAASDIDGLLNALARSALQMGSAVGVEVVLALAGAETLASECALRADGSRDPLTTHARGEPLIAAALKEATPQLGRFAHPAELGFAPHAIVVPISPAMAPETLSRTEATSVASSSLGASSSQATPGVSPPLELRAPSDGEDPQPIGVLVLGYHEAPAMSSGLMQALGLIADRFLLQFHRLWSRRVRARHADRVALLNDVSGFVVQEGPSEQRFIAAIRRIEEAFDLETVALYAGRPLTLRVLRGGRPVRLGVPVPEGAAMRAFRERAAVIVEDLSVSDVEPCPPWVAPTAMTEVALPLMYRNHRVGVLDLYSAHVAAFDVVDLQILATLARQLTLLIVREGEGREMSGDSSLENGGTLAQSDRPPSQSKATTRDGNGDSAQAAEQLQLAYDRLHEFAELKDQILQNISHELRTPLTLIKGYLELMMEGQMGELLPEQRQSLDVVLLKVDDVARIVEEIVSLSPLNRLSMDYRRIPVADLIAELAMIFVQRTEGSSIIWDFESVADDLYLSGDLDQIRQVFYNILDNAVKFSPEGGRIRIRAVSEGAHVHVVIRDQGIGIPKQRLNRIFETFYQVDGSSTRRFGGLGLGLAVVNRVVRAHNGKVWAESESGRGSTFHVLLPKYLSPHQIFQPAAMDHA